MSARPEPSTNAPSVEKWTTIWTTHPTCAIETIAAYVRQARRRRGSCFRGAQPLKDKGHAHDDVTKDHHGIVQVLAALD